MIKIKTHFPVIFAFSVTVLSLIGVGIWFKSNTDELIDHYIKGAMEENCKTQAVSLSTRINDQLDFLNAQARYFKDINMNDEAQVKKQILALKSVSTFKLIGVCMKNGQSFSNRGDEFDAKGFPFFENGIKGKAYIHTNTAQVPEFGATLSYAVPIIQDERTTGIIFGLSTTNELNTLIEGLSSSPYSASILIAADGSILARSKNPQLITDRIMNFFDLGSEWGFDGELSLSSIKNLIGNSETAIVPYKAGTKERLAILTPVDDHEWYFAVITQMSVITSLSTKIAKQIILIEIILSLSFCLLLTSIIYLQSNNNLISKTNEKFKLVTKQSQTIVFDFDFGKKTIELSGDTEFLTGEQVESIAEKEINRFLRLVHKDDASFVKELLNIETTVETSISREVRILCFDGHYYWFKMLGSVVRDDNNKPRRFIGNLVNVDETIHKEQLLKQRAEKDPMTGLLNKGAFRENVEEILAKASPFDYFAFYIIDLDNFKKVNDTMGHSAGDSVLSDTAKKLCMVFSENDYIGRIGGDEFTVFLKLSEDGKKYAEKIIAAKAKAVCSHLNEIYSDGKIEINVSSSVGIAVFPQHGLTYDDLFKNADSALYQSKKGGKNQFTLYNDSVEQYDPDLPEQNP